jgi:asparagine synthase (glutamine-hydrolysing)
MRIAHRGPDDEAFFADQHLALGFRRLAIIDTSAAGRQPMQSADGRFVMVFDGEIYNYVELAQRLHARGVRLRSRSAAEVLLEMYAWLGKDVVRQLRGMYAFAIWDRRNRELFCARDPFGIKPFFYALTTGGQRPRSGPQLRFASERKALAGPGEVTAIDPDALRRYLSFQYVPAPATLVPPARALPPGHVLIARPGGRVDVFRYWRPELRPARSPSSSSPDKILTALRDSVAAHLRSDVPVGAFLSGGVDSATLCALAAESVPDLLTFTVGFDREGYSEIDEAMATAAALGVKSVPYLIGPSTSRWCCPARAPTSCSAATASTTSRAWSGPAGHCPAGDAARSAGSPPRCRPEPGARASSTGPPRRCDGGTSATPTCTTATRRACWSGRPTARSST